VKLRKIVLALCLLAFVLGLSACGFYRYSQNCVSDLNGVSMYTEKATYAPDDYIINVVWKNKTSLTLTFGEPFSLEKKTDSGWEKVGAIRFFLWRV